LDYNDAIVLTHDKWKFDAGGLPQFSFLLPTSQDPSDPQVDDDDVLLLGIEGTAPLSMEADLHAVGEESLRSALSSNNDPAPSTVLDVDLDPFSRTGCHSPDYSAAYWAPSKRTTSMDARCSSSGPTRNQATC
jgi:hypothetical protein